ncbi:MAG: ABC transporter permease [Myxococcota bacterium]|nr:ABC transporter permease [Myxococcota bacterium]
MNSNWANLVARRDLVRELTLSQLRSQSQRTSLGWLFWLVDPLVMMLIYWAVVVGIFGRGASYAPYPVFILCALLPWKHLTASLNSAASVLRNSEALIKSIPFPTMALPLTAVLAAFWNFLCGLVVLAVAAVAFERPLGASVVQLPALIALQLVLVTGLALAVACLGALVRDLGGFLGHILRVGFYASPTLYGVDLVHERLAGAVRGGVPVGEWLYALYMANPFAMLITGYRDAVFYGEFLETRFWLVLVAEAALVLLIGYRLYRHFDRRVIKFL